MLCDNRKLVRELTAALEGEAPMFIVGYLEAQLIKLLEIVEEEDRQLHAKLWVQTRHRINARKGYP